MEDIIQIRLSNENLGDEANKEKLVTFYTGLITLAKDKSLWDDSIKTIIITDDLENEVKKQALKWNLKYQISKEKEYRVVSKIFFNQNLKDPEHCIFISFQSLLIEKVPIDRIFLGSLIDVYSRNLIPIKYQEEDIKNNPVSLNGYIRYAATDWIKADFTRKRLNELIIEPYDPFIHNSFLIAFKRKLKKYLFDYNSDKFANDQRLGIFWSNYYSSIWTFFLRLAETNYENKNIQIKENESSYSLIYNVLAEIDALTESLIIKKEFNIDRLKDAIKKFSAHYEVFLEDENDKSFRIRLTKDPKDYFNDEIVETEPRFVCFIDILGFSDLINDYDSDITSTVLQDIQESFSLAKTYLIDNNVNQFKESLKHLKYQTFSDNICISIPYFDNQTDFLSNFNLVTTYIRGLQFTLMSKGFFTRGGISIGSFYSDNNIIFSKGLVNAYLLESKKANFPRVIIDKLIVDKLFSYDQQSIKNFGLDKVIIFDWENISFLNPFGLIESSLSQINSIFNDLETDTDDPMVNSLNSFSQQVSNMTKELFSSISNAEEQSIELIKDKIDENIIRFSQNENVLSKYLWIKEFIKWLEKDATGNLKFQFLKEKLTTISD